MLRVKEVHGLLFDWAREWRKGGEPEKLNEFFQTLVEGRKFKDLCDIIIRDITQESDSNIGVLQIGALIAALLVILPTKDFGGARGIALDKMVSIQKGQNDIQPIRFHHGCILGFLKATVLLQKLDDPYEDLENQLWKLILCASKSADDTGEEQEQGCCNFKEVYGGSFSNLLTEYLSEKLGGVSPAEDLMKSIQGKRLKIMGGALTDFSKSMKRNGEILAGHYPITGSTRFLVNEMAYKVFGKFADDSDRMQMIVNFLKHREQ